MKLPYCSVCMACFTVQYWPCIVFFFLLAVYGTALIINNAHRKSLLCVLKYVLSYVSRQCVTAAGDVYSPCSTHPDRDWIGWGRWLGAYLLGSREETHPTNDLMQCCKCSSIILWVWVESVKYHSYAVSSTTLTQIPFTYIIDDKIHYNSISDKYELVIRELYQNNIKV